MKSFLVQLNGCATSGNSLVKNKLVRILSSEYNERNAWNQNLSSGQVNNNNNKYNFNVVRPVAALDDEKVNGWMSAYFDCLSNKMTSEQCTLYRLHEDDLIELMRECEERRYVPGTSVCFIVTRPKLREIFAANFRDRIVQHWICQRIEPLLEQRFVSQGDVSWNCRKGRGTQRAVLALRRDVLEASKNYTRTAWIGRFDIRSFFMSIDIRILERYIVAFVRKHYRGKDLELLVYLLTITIRHRPQNNCIRRGGKEMWENLPKHKSLFYAESFRGMPIGNITSQLLANFYMSFLDGYMIGLCKEIGARYERFVDDFVVVSRRKEDVCMLRDKASSFLKKHLNLEMHQDKVYIQETTKGVYFVGSVIKKERVYIANRTVGGMTNILRSLQNDLQRIKTYSLRNSFELEHYQSSLNSYFGLMKGKNAYALKRRIIKENCPLLFKYFYIKGRYDSVRIRKEYNIKHQIIKQENYG